MSQHREYAEICATVIHETEMAVLLDDGDQRKWVPKSCIQGGYDLEYGGDMDLDMVLWFAEEEEWI